MNEYPKNGPIHPIHPVPGDERHPSKQDWREFVVPGRAVGKGRPRARRIGKGVQMYTDEQTLSAEAWVRHCGYEALGQPVLEGPLEVHMSVVVAVPGSWSGKRRAEALAGRVYPTGKPDADNMAKLLSDALNGILWRDDSQIVDLFVTKRYGAQPHTRIRLRIVT